MKANGKHTPDDDPEGGRGADTYLTPVQENKLVGMAVRRRWKLHPRDKRWAIRATRKNIKSEDGRISNGAVRNMLTMEAQNMQQEAADNPRQQQGPAVQVNVGVHVEVKQDDGWYSNDAHRLAAEGAAAPVADSAVAGTVQGGGVRPALGKNGNGANGHH